MNATADAIDEGLKLSIVEATQFSTMKDVRDYLNDFEAETLAMVIDHAISPPEDHDLAPSELRLLRNLASCANHDLLALGKLAATDLPAEHLVRVQADELDISRSERRAFFLLALQLGAELNPPHVALIAGLLRADELEAEPMAS